MIINEGNLTAFRKDFKKAVEELEKKYDVTISLGSITYEEDRFSSRMSVKNGSDPDDVARMDFDADAWKYAHLGIQRGMYKRIFVGLTGQRYAIVGINTRAKKYPLEIISVSDGLRHRAPESFIREWTDEYYIEARVVGES